MMTMDQHFARADTASAHGHSAIASWWSDFGLWMRTCARYYEAALTYEELARLSDAELVRRGLSRDTLAREVCSLCERCE
jgi:hypothetical protein